VLDSLDMTSIKPKERNFASALGMFAGSVLLIYGAGGFGREILHYLRQAGLMPRAFLDQRASELRQVEGLPVFLAEEAPVERQTCTVLFSIVIDKESRCKAISHLESLGYGSIIESQSLRCLLVQPDDQGAESIEAYYHSRAGRIQAAEHLFQDEQSLGVYRSNVYAHTTGDYAVCAQWESPMVQQYFPADIPLRKGFRRFLDCGGYIGDTTEQAVAHEGALEACAIFEPDSGNYAQMVRRMDDLRDRIGERWLFPCAVSESAGISRFSQGTGSGALSEQGDGVVQMVSLDQAVPDFHPTYIKMDIEGAEPAALLGARQIICRDRPDLAVCVYHGVNHIWDIPLLLDSWGLGYRFFLRCYNSHTMETVLYAAADGKMR